MTGQLGRFTVIEPNTDAEIEAALRLVVKYAATSEEVADLEAMLTAEPSATEGVNEYGMRRDRRMSHGTPIVCGSNGGYVRHRRAHQEACEPCKAAHAVYVANRKRDRAEAAS